MAAADLDAFEPTTRIPEGALEAAIAEARTPAPVKGTKKRTAKAKAPGKPVKAVRASKKKTPVTP